MGRSKIIIVGGGASGLVAGIIGARNGAKVTIIERKEKIGKKILILVIDIFQKNVIILKIRFLRCTIKFLNVVT